MVFSISNELCSNHYYQLGHFHHPAPVSSHSSFFPTTLLQTTTNLSVPMDYGHFTIAIVKISYECNHKICDLCLILDLMVKLSGFHNCLCCLLKFSRDLVSTKDIFFLP